MNIMEMTILTLFFFRGKQSRIFPKEDMEQVENVKARQQRSSGSNTSIIRNFVWIGLTAAWG